MIVPLAAAFLYLLSVFSFGISGDLAARESMFPARMFTLPVTTGGLAGWPMLYGAAAMVMLWFGTRLLGLWPVHGGDAPLFWPALLAASLLAWTQALTWMPYPLRGLRVIVSVLWLTVIDAVVIVALQFRASEPVMLALLAPLVPLAYGTARFAVGRARRGEVPDWRGVLSSIGRSTDVRQRARKHFRSPSRAQMWFEWRLYGWSLPVMVAIVVPLELSLLFIFKETPSIIFELLLGVLLTPPFMASVVAATVRKSSPYGSDSHGLTPFFGTRPLSSASLVAAKLKATACSALAAWLLVLVAIPVMVKLSGAWPVILGWWRDLNEALGTARAIVLVLLVISFFVASTWKQLVQSLTIGLSGRGWVVKASVFSTLALFAILVPLGHWIIGSKAAVATLWTALPWIGAVLVCLKMIAASWIAVELHDRGLLRDRTLLLGVAYWDAAVFALFGLLLWLLPLVIFRTYVLAYLAILAVPLARLSLAPLALSWNRHR